MYQEYLTNLEFFINSNSDLLIGIIFAISFLFVFITNGGLYPDIPTIAWAFAGGITAGPILAFVIGVLLLGCAILPFIPAAFIFFVLLAYLLKLIFKIKT